MSNRNFSTGIETLDDLLQEVRPGDSIVFHLPTLEQYGPFVKALLHHSRRVPNKLVYVRVDGLLEGSLRGLSDEDTFDVIKCCRDPQAFAQEFEEYLRCKGKHVYCVFESLKGMRSVLGSEGLLKTFFVETCSLLYQLEAIAYWPLLKEEHPKETIAAIKDCAQVFLDLSARGGDIFINPVKVRGRHSERMFVPHRVFLDGDLPRLSSIPEEELDLRSYAAQLQEKCTELLELKDGLDEAKRQLLQRNKELSALNAVSRTVSESLELDQILANAFDKVLEVVELKPRAGIFLLDAGTQELHLRAHRGLSEEWVRQESRIQVGECLCGLVAQTGEVLFSGDCRQDARHTRVGYPEPHTHVVVPLKSKNSVLGVMFFYPHGAYRPNPGDMQLFAAIGDQIGLAIDRASLYKRTRSKVEDLQKALETRKLVERAKWMVMNSLQLSEPEAFKQMQRQARNRNMKLGDLARSIIDAFQAFQRVVEE